MKSVWLDCDPGHDDMMAIILAAFSEEIDLKGIITSAGNQTLEKTTKNALKVLALCGREDIPVVKGLSKPLVRKGSCCPEIHGESGLAGSRQFDEMEVELEPVARNGIEYSYERIRDSYEKGHPITYVATGCLTNLAVLLTVYPDIRTFLAGIVLMGGAVRTVGNITPSAEFNIYLDPEAAKIVVDSGVPHIVMTPLEVTHTVLVTPERIAQMKQVDQPVIPILLDLLAFFKQQYADVMQFTDPPLHDPVAMAYVCNPSLFTLNHLHVDIELASPTSYGMTVADYLRLSPNAPPPNVHVVEAVDIDGFWDLMIGALRKIGNKQ